MNVLPHFARKWFQLCHTKTWKRLKNALFKCSEHSFLSSRLLQNHFLRRFLGWNLHLNSFALFHFTRKQFRFCCWKICKKTEKWHFRRFTRLAFDFKVASKPSNLKTFDFFASLSSLASLGRWFAKLKSCEKCDFETLWKLSCF